MSETAAPANRPLFYGWWIVSASVVGLALSWPVFAIYAFGPFVRPLQAEFGWQRGEMSVAILVVSFTAIAVSIGLGFLVDRVGVRRIMLGSIVALAATIAAMSQLTAALWHFYLMYFLIAIVGGGTSVLVFSKLILNWFDRKRGLALGISIAGVGVGSGLVPMVATYLITHVGWRDAYLTLGLVTLIVSGGTALLVVREHPALLGLGKDGEPTIHGQSSTTLNTLGYTAKQALRTRAVQLILFAFFLIGFATQGAAVHLMPLLQDRGIPAPQAAQFLLIMGISVIFGRILAGYLMDRLFAPHVAIIFMLAPMLGLGLLALGVSGGSALLATSLLGLAIGAEFDILGYFTSRYTGLKAFGLLYGLTLGSFQLGGGIGPWLMGAGFDAQGNYNAVLWGFAASLLLTCVAFAFLGPYPRLPEE